MKCEVGKDKLKILVNLHVEFVERVLEIILFSARRVGNGYTRSVVV